MSAIITTIKIIMFLFPFLKELFIGKGTPSAKKAKMGSFEKLMKLSVIAIGCFSVALNVYLAGRVYGLGKENLNFQKQIKEFSSKVIDCPKHRDVIKAPMANTSPIENKRPERDERHFRRGAALPPDRETYIKELERINNIR